ncbi:MAG TPA: efflux RND transporter permease subunit [Longimicrobiales bacterium]|nr:efflux RND transporter permease subunit [Longimicrobiales bacterium]
MSDEGRSVSDEKGGPIAFMARNSIAANLLMVVLLVGGVWAAFGMQKEVYPQYALDVVTVSVAYPGASPAEVEQGILRPVEEAIRGIQGIRDVTATAEEGSGNVSIELVGGIDRMKAFQDVDQAVNRIRTFPDDIEEPEVQLESNQREVMSLAVYGSVDVWTLRQVAERLRDRLLSDPGITQVELGNVPGYVTHVEIPRERLREYDLTLAEVGDLIAASSRDIPAGAVESSSGEVLLRMQERKQWAEEFRRIEIVSSASGGAITLGDIAEIRDGFEEIGFFGQFNEQPSIDLQVFRVGDQSPLEISEAVEVLLDDARSDLPEGVQIRVDSSAAEDYGARLSLLAENGILAILIVLGVLALFLELTVAFWVMAGMTISFVGAILFMPLVGLSINMISMFGFLVVLGIVVDDAIVVGENIHERREQGMAPMEAAIAGARDVARPVTFAILTNILAFLPLLFIPGTTGKYWWPLPVVVILVLIISLVEAFFILPAHLGHAGSTARWGPTRRIAAWQQLFARKFKRFVDTRYRALLDRCLRDRWITLSASLALLLVVGGYAWSGHMGMVLMPEAAADEVEGSVQLPVGTTVDQAARVARRITDRTLTMFEENDLYEVAEGVKTNVRGQSYVDVEAVMRPPTERDMSAQEFAELWRTEIGDIEGVDQISFEAERGPGGWRQDIEVDLSHSDPDVLAEASQVFRQRVEAFSATRDVTDSYDRGKDRFDFVLLPEGRRLGLTPDDVGRQLRNAFFGDLALRQLRGTNEVEIRVKLPREQRTSLYALEDLVIRTPTGTEVPLLEVARIEQDQAFSSIDRRNGRRVVTVGMDAQPPSAVSRVLASLQDETLPELRADFPGITWSFEGSQADTREATAALWGSFGMALLAIYALLAIALGSYVQPVVVMGAIPFGLVGAVLGHIVLGYDLSLVSVMGVVALSGVVLNDSLIMIDFANKRRREGSSAFDAIHQAGLRRFRPIVLTTLTTFGGLTPIILERSDQARQLVPMAISLGFGIVFATAIILVIVPSLYLILEDVKGALGRMRDRVGSGPTGGEAAA